jgi:peptide/nickel transport system substrate-binding protein
MKWSDGKPLTTADVMFWWEDVANNKELSPSLPSWIKIGGQPGTISAVDDYTFQITFPQPYGAFTVMLPTTQTWMPSHYLKKFHADYAAQAALDAAMEDEGLDTWTDLWAAKTAYANNPGTPNTQPWNPTNYVDEPVQVWERNPYYWKVDIEGNQLPYIDQVNRILVPDQEAILLKVLAGEANFQSRRIESVQNYPTVMENREKGDYRVLLEDNAGSNLASTYCNFFSKDPVIRELMREKDFRHALSLAIDRDEINGIVFDGLATPSAVSVAIGTPWYKPEYGTENPWIAYDPDQANALLDGLGLDQRDNAGYRLRPDGERLSLVHLVQSTQSLAHGVEVHEITKGYWADVGIEVITKPTERQVWSEQVRAAEHDIASYSANFGHLTQNPVQRGDFAPRSGQLYWALGWGLWYETDGQDGEEPPAEIKRCYELYAEALAEPDRDTRIGLVQQILDIHAEQTYIIGMVNESDYGRWDVVTNDIGGLPDRIYGSNGLATQFSLMFFRS